MRLISFVLLFAPLIVFLLDRGGIWPGGVDPLTASLIAGGAGVLLLTISARGSLGGMIASLVGGALFLALQIYAIAYYILGL